MACRTAAPSPRSLLSEGVRLGSHTGFPGGQSRPATLSCLLRFPRCSTKHPKHTDIRPRPEARTLQTEPLPHSPEQATATRRAQCFCLSDCST